MAFSPQRWLERAIPNRRNRSLWALIAGLGYAIVLTGPIVATFVYDAVYQVAIVPTLLWLWTVNITTYTAAIAVGLVVLSRIREPLSDIQAVLFAVALTVLGAVVRVAVLLPTSAGPLPETKGPFIIVQFALGLIVVAALTAAVVYATVRERVLEDAFRDLARANASLAHEEEAVRSEVFDQLHGSLQSEFVAVRRRLDDLAEQTTDPHAAEVARGLDRTLDRLYSQGVGAVARALTPPGIEVGLQTALAELGSRLDPAVDLRVHVDAVAAALDDPMAGGLHQGLRVASYRIIEEATSNAMRHSGARVVDVDVRSTLEHGESMLAIQISHDVDGEVALREGSGLSRMRARAQALGGSVTCTAGTGRFVVSATLPLALPDGGRWAEVETRRG